MRILGNFQVTLIEKTITLAKMFTSRKKKSVNFERFRFFFLKTVKLK